MSIKMGSQILWVTFILAVHLSAVWGRNQYHEYYYSRYHHKSHSTTKVISSPTAEFSTEVQTVSSVSENSAKVQTISSVSEDFESTRMRNGTVHSYRYDYDNDVENSFAMKADIIVGCSGLFVVFGCCLFCCIRICRRRNAVRRGFIIADRTQRPAHAVLPQQPAASHPPGHAHQYPPPYQEERTQLFPTQYQPQQYADVQNSQYSPTAPLDHNPPEAPPPYEFPEKF